MPIGAVEMVGRRAQRTLWWCAILPSGAAGIHGGLAYAVRGMKAVVFSIRAGGVQHCVRVSSVLVGAAVGRSVRWSMLWAGRSTLRVAHGGARRGATRARFIGRRRPSMARLSGAAYAGVMRGRCDSLRAMRTEWRVLHDARSSSFDGEASARSVRCCLERAGGFVGEK